MTKVFDSYSLYYDLLYSTKDYSSEVAYVDSLINRFYSGAKNIMDLGCGTGKHALFMAEKGYEVFGVDLSETMIQMAEKLNNPKVECVQGDIRDFRVDRKFDVVTSLFHVQSYQTSNDDLLKSFKTAREHLNQNGIFVFDFWYGPGVLTDRPGTRIKKFSNDQVRIVRHTESVMHADTNVVDVNFEVMIIDKNEKVQDTLKETHSMRYFFEPELENFLAQAGFKLECSEEWMTGENPGFNTWNACMVARAI